MTYVRISLLTTERREPFMMGKRDCSSVIVVRRLLLLAKFFGFYLSFKFKHMVLSSIQVQHASSMQHASKKNNSTPSCFLLTFSMFVKSYISVQKLHGVVPN